MLQLEATQHHASHSTL